MVADAIAVAETVSDAVAVELSLLLPLLMLSSLLLFLLGVVDITPSCY